MKASWARWPPDSEPGLWGLVKVLCLDTRRANEGPTPIQPGTRKEVVGHLEAGIGRGVLGDETDTGQLPGASAAGGRSQHGDTCLRSVRQPDRQIQERCLSRPVRPDQPDHVARRDLQAAVLEGPAPAVAFAQTLGVENRSSRYVLLGRRTERFPEQGLDALLVQAGPAGLDEPALQGWRSGPAPPTPAAQGSG